MHRAVYFVFCRFAFTDDFFELEDFAVAGRAVFFFPADAVRPKTRSQPSENLLVEPVLTV